MARQAPRKLPKGIFIRDGAYWLLYYVNGVRKRERVGPDKCRAGGPRRTR